MVKNLIRKVREGALLLTAMFSLIFASCKFPDFPIIADLKVSPTSGATPLETIITLNGNKRDITEYEIDIDNNRDGTIDETIKQRYPMNIGRLFTVNTDVYGQVTDSSGAINRVKQTVTVDNSIPVAIFSARQQDTNPDIIVNLDGNDLNGKQDIIKYRMGIDENNDNMLEENEVKITSNSPIINGIIPINYGTYNLLGECVDSQGAIGRAGIEVIVSSQPVPTANLTVSATSGNFPLEDSINLDGSETNGTIVKYEIGIDGNNNGRLEDSEIIATSTTSAITKEIIFTKPSTYKVLGQVTDSNGNIGRANQQVDVSSGNQSTNLTETIQFPDSYTAGSKFTFIGQINNNTNPYSPITVDNSLGDSLEYRLIREIVSGVGEKIIDEKLQANVKITLNQSGYLKLEQKSDDNFYLTIANANITYNGFTLPVGNNPFIYSLNHPCYAFEKSGNYSIETIIKYLMSDSPSVFTFLSDSFSVN